MRKPLREMKTIRSRVFRLLAADDGANYVMDTDGTIDAALDAAQPVLDEARAGLARRGRDLHEANKEIARRGDVIRRLENEVKWLRAGLAEEQRVAASLRSSRTEIRTKLNEALKAADADRDRLTAQIDDVRRTAADLHDFNSPEGDHLPWCMGCRLERETGEENEAADEQA